MIRITDIAKEKIVNVMISEKTSIVRFGLQGGGCNGFTHFFSTTASQEEDDTVIPLGDTYSMVIDAMSIQYLENTTIDYKKDIMGESFVFENPDQKGSCGCGQSVSF